MAVFESVKSEFPEKFAANAAHRAFVDYHDDIISSPINLHQLATIALSVPQLEIIKILNG